MFKTLSRKRALSALKAWDTRRARKATFDRDARNTAINMYWMHPDERAAAFPKLLLHSGKQMYAAVKALVAKYDRESREFNLRRWNGQIQGETGYNPDTRTVEEQLEAVMSKCARGPNEKNQKAAVSRMVDALGTFMASELEVPFKDAYPLLRLVRQKLLDCVPAAPVVKGNKSTVSLKSVLAEPPSGAECPVSIPRKEAGTELPKEQVRFPGWIAAKYTRKGKLIAPGGPVGTTFSVHHPAYLPYGATTASRHRQFCDAVTQMASPTVQAKMKCCPHGALRPIETSKASKKSR